MLTKEKVAEVVREMISAWNAGDIDAVAKIDVDAVGFGFRTAPWRDRNTAGVDGHRQGYKTFLDGLESWHTEIEELHTSLEDDVGLAWGVHTEHFRVKGREPEKALVRFTMALKRNAETWRVILFHRDIQQFDEQGMYLMEHTKVPQD